MRELLDTNDTITMWMPLVDVPASMGALTFASGSQREGFLGHLKISDGSEEHFDDLVRGRGFPLAVDAMAAGDATFHPGWILHNAPGNPTDWVRDMGCWLPGLKPGDLAASELNPLVYSRK